MDSLHNRTASRLAVPLLMVAAWFLGHETQAQPSLNMPSLTSVYLKVPAALPSSATQAELSVRPWKPASANTRQVPQRWVF
ncbi:hypothetical protein ACFQDN_07920 [Pseudomonas asuensis]|jgi:hypothetical protein|uniref:Uncharacterized protein n=1 Tax=Pseudomonas asuensis TaxID=1825787 RepID=A0ABQ2GX62_9PSED|nr:hypothetical protein [Pseudomonas asuensis]GGM15289.1 hypothetical protein GCM10009425_27760 [Pseudomonas asuensis]